MLDTDDPMTMLRLALLAICLGLWAVREAWYARRIQQLREQIRAAEAQRATERASAGAAAGPRRTAAQDGVEYEIRYVTAGRSSGRVAESAARALDLSKTTDH